MPLYSVAAALGAGHVPKDAEQLQQCLDRQLRTLRAHQTLPFAQLVGEYSECARRAREAEVRAGQLDKEAAELREEVASLALRCALAGGGGGEGATTSTVTPPTSTSSSNAAVAARALAARADAYRAELQRARQELSAAYRERSVQLEQREDAERRERRLRAVADETAEALALAREECAALRSKLLESAKEVDSERTARDLAVRESRARADDRERAERRADALARDNADLVSRLVSLREAEAARLDQINRLHEEALEARRKVQVDAAADRQLLGLLRKGVSSAAGAAGSALLGAAAGLRGGGGGAAQAPASQQQQQHHQEQQQQPAYYASLREKMGLPSSEHARPATVLLERCLPRSPAAVGAAVHSGGLAALAWEPPPLASGPPHSSSLHLHHSQHALGGSGSGHHLASGGNDRAVRIWDARAAMAAGAAAAGAARSSDHGGGGAGGGGSGPADGTAAMSAAAASPLPTTATITTPTRLLPVATYAGGAIMGAVADAGYSCDGRRLVGAMGDGRLLVWESATGQLRHALTGHTAAVVAAACYPLDPGWCVSAGEDRALKLWDLARGHCARSVPTARLPNALALASDGSGALITGHVDGSLCVWDFRQGTARPAAASSSSSSSVGESAKDHPGTVLCVAPVGPLAAGAAAAGGAGGGGGAAVSTADAVAAAYGASGASAVLTVCRDNAARVWDYRQMRTVCVLRASSGGGGGGVGGGGPVAGGGGGGFSAGSMGGMGRGRCRAGVSPDGRFVAVGGADGGVYVWDMAAVGRAAALQQPAAAAAAPPGSVTALRYHRDAVVAGSWSPDGELLATGDRAGHLAIWRMERAAAAGSAG
jgi:WD40 repeat protein